MVMRKLAIFFISFLFLSFAVVSEGANGFTPIINEIEIVGNRIIEGDTIRYQIKTQVGDNLDLFQIRQDIVNIYKIGYIEDVQVESETFKDGIKLIYKIKERPWVKSIIFEGNKKIKDDELKEKIELKEKTFLDKGKVNQAIDNLIQHYHKEGYYIVEIDYKLDYLEDDRVNMHILINEGKKVKIKKVLFSGNYHSSDKTIRKHINTKNYGLFSFITKRGFLNREMLEDDRARIQNLYLDKGFINCQVSPPVIEFNDQKSYLTIKFSIKEGDQYNIKDISFMGNLILPTDMLSGLISSKPGDVYSRSELSRDIMYITDAYGEKGYRTTDVFPMISEDKDDKSLSITFQIREGEPSYLRKINIIGNHKTRDKVIRREMQIKEGGLLDTKRMKESYRRIRNLGFFESLDMKTIPTKSENEFDLDIMVEERLTGQISFGAGYSSEDHLVGTFEIRQGNLFGRGHRLLTSAEFGGERQTYNISFTEPYVMDKPLTMGTGIYYDIKEYDRFTRSTRGGDLSFGFPLFTKLRLYTEYSHEIVNIHELDIDIYNKNPEDLTSYERILLEEEGITRTSSLLFAISKDTRDDPFRPTSGSQNRISFRYAGGFLGGNNWFYTTSMDSGHYIPLSLWKFVLAIHGNLAYSSGHSGRNLPVFERLYCGGQTTVRGYLQKSVGPKDADDIPTGGNKRVVFNIELHFPVYEAMSGLFFFDAGNVYEESQDFFAHSLRMGAGIGIRLYTPMGPMRLDWGYKLLRDIDESPSDWHFAMGTYF